MKSRLICLFVLMAFVPFVSAEIFIGQTNEVYNVGDQISIGINLIPNSQIADHFKANLICGEINTNIFNQFYSLNTGQEQGINVVTYLNKNHFLIVNETETNSGNGTNTTLEETFYDECYILFEYGPEIESTDAFTVSRDIIFDLELDFGKFDPGAYPILSGTAQKESGLTFNGFLELFVDSLNVYETSTISNGNVNLSFRIPDDSKSGNHNLTVRVYETNNQNEVINEGYFVEFFEVNKKLKDLAIILSSETLSPGEPFDYKVIAYDQADDVMPYDVSVEFYKPNDLVFFKKLIKSDASQTMEVSINETPGYWKIEAQSGEIQKRKIFYVEEVFEIQTSLINDTLIVKNVGNVIYDKPLEITIGSTVEIKQLNLKIGETQRFKLRAPDGDYQISVNDGSDDTVLGNVYLTGRAISVTDIREGFVEVVGNPLVWWLVVILFVLIVIFVYVKRRLLNRKKDGQVSKSAVKPVKSKVSENKNMAASSGIENGSKEQAYVIAVKSRSDSDSSYITRTINDALNHAKNSGAKVYVDGDYKIIVLSPKLTKNKENGTNVVKIANQIESILQEHNRKYKEKIHFGIGVNSGEIISEIDGHHFKFTTTGNLITVAKRIAQKHTMNVQLSDQAHRSMNGAVKMRKSAEGFWEIERVVDREQHNSFLEKFRK